MAAIFCINKNSKEYKDTVVHFGTTDAASDYTQYLFHKNNGNPLTQTPFGEPSILYSELLRAANGNVHSAITAKAYAYNHEFMDKFGIDWTITKLSKSEYDVYDNGEPTKAALLGAMSSHKVDKIGSVGVAGKMFPIYSNDRAILDDIINNSSNIYDVLNTLFASPFTKGLIDNPAYYNMLNLLTNTKGSVNDIKLVVNTTDETNKHFMGYNPKKRTITIYKNTIDSYPSVEAFFVSFMHELAHSYTVAALRNPVTAEDAAFKEEVTTIFSTLQHSDQAYMLNQYGLKNAEEFLALFITDDEFNSKLQQIRFKSDKITVWRKLVDSIIKWWSSITTGKINDKYGSGLYDHLNEVLGSFLDYQSRYWDSSEYEYNKNEETAFADITSTLADIKNSVDQSNPDTIEAALLAIKEMVVTPDDKVVQILANDPNAYKPAVAHVYDIKGEPQDVAIKNPWKSVTEARDEYIRSTTKGEWESKQSEETLANLERGGNIGKVIHQLVNGTITNSNVDILRLTGVAFNPAVKKTLGLFSTYDDATNETTYSGIIADLVKIADPYGKGGNKVLSEVTILDADKRIIGTIDLMVITRDGKIHLYDFKTKAGRSGFAYYKDTKTKSGRKKHSDQVLYRTQLLMYANMLTKTLGVKVEATHVVMLSPNVIDMDIAGFNDPDYNVLVDNTIKEGKNTIPYIESVSLAVHSAPEDADIHNGIDTPTVNAEARHIVTKVLGSTISMGDITRYSTETDIDTQLERLRKKANDPNNRLRELRIKLIASLEERYETIRRRHSESDIQEFSTFLDELAGENSIPASFARIVQHAIDETDLVRKEMKDIDDGNKVLTSFVLRGWRDYFTAYSILDQLSYEVSKDPTLIDKGLYDQLKTVIGFKNELKLSYNEKGKALVAKEIYKYYGGSHYEAKEKYRRVYRLAQYYKKNGFTLAQMFDSMSLNHNLSVNKEDIEDALNNTIEDYINIKVSKNSEDLDKLSYDIIFKELDVASNGINDFNRLLDAAVDSSDPVISSVIQLWIEKHREHMQEAIAKKTEFYNVVKEVEDYMSANNLATKRGGFKSEKEIWSAFLEHDSDGNTTGYLISPILSSFEESRNKMNQEAIKKDTIAARQIRSRWYKDTHKLDDEIAQGDYFGALYTFLTSLADKKEIDSATISNLMANAQSRESVSWGKLAKPTLQEDINEATHEPIITKEVADKIYKWENANKELYIVPKEMWHNKEWERFIQTTLGSEYIGQPFWKQYEALENSTHPYAKLYLLLQRTSRETDNNIPYGFYVKNRLPGVGMNTDERMRLTKNPLKVLKGELSQGFLVKADDDFRNTNVATDAEGKKLNLLPVYYTNTLPDDEQSYDLPTIYFKYWMMGNNYSKNREIISTMELAKEFIDSRKTLAKSATGVQLYRKNRSKRNTIQQEQLENNDNLAKQFDAWFNMYVLNNTTKAPIISFGDWQFDLQKAVTGLNNMTSLNLLGFNFVNGISNIMMGETMTKIEAISKEFFTSSQLLDASKEYLALLPAMLGDIGSRRPTSKGSLLFEAFDVLNEGVYGDAKFSNATRLKALCKTESTQFLNLSGEHLMRGRAFLAMLLQVTAYDSNGNVLGRMIDQYSVKDGKLVIDPKVNLTKSKWTQHDQDKFFNKFHGIMYRTHGAYGKLEKVALEMSALGQLAYLFRRFVWPGIKRRYGKKQYITRMDQTMEGNYVSLFKFFNKLHKDSRGMSLALLTEHWTSMSEHEQANVKRTIAEMATLMVVITLASICYKQWGDADDDEPGEERFWAMMAYQLYRLKAELLFYSPKIDEAMSLLRSPLASMSMFENVINLSSQLFNPVEVYERGPWKGQLKIKKDLIQFIPVYKQWYKFRDIEEQIQWFR